MSCPTSITGQTTLSLSREIYNLSDKIKDKNDIKQWMRWETFFDLIVEMHVH